MSSLVMGREKILIILGNGLWIYVGCMGVMQQVSF